QYRWYPFQNDAPPSWLRFGGWLSGCAPLAFRNCLVPHPQRADLLLNLGYRKLASSADDSCLRHEWAPAVFRSRPPVAPLLASQARLQEREVSDRRQFSSDARRRVLAGPGL